MIPVVYPSNGNGDGSGNGNGSGDGSGYGDGNKTQVRNSEERDHEEDMREYFTELESERTAL